MEKNPIGIELCFKTSILVVSNKKNKLKKIFLIILELVIQCHNQIKIPNSLVTFPGWLFVSYSVLFFCLIRSFISYTMSVIAVNFVVPLTVMFYCYYNVSRTMKQYASSNCLESLNIDWSDQVDVTKVNECMFCFKYVILCLSPRAKGKV